MNVGELIDELKHLDRESEVILQRDPEGNGYSEVEGADPEAVFVVYDSDVEVYNSSEEELDPDCKPCVVIYPTR